jgi:RimJ/RimL family protein N-acetyltransferase
LLEGKTVNLRIVEKEDLSLVAEWLNNPDFFGEYDILMQVSKSDLQKSHEDISSEGRWFWFFIEKKDGSKVGEVGHKLRDKAQEIGYSVLPNERKKGYCSEAVVIMVDYLFLSKDVVRIQAHTDLRNLDSQRVLEKTGFKREGTIRKSNFIRGEWRDTYLYSILREEWKQPKILTKTEKK